MNEPSVLDYIKSKLNPWSKDKIEIKGEDFSAEGVGTSQQIAAADSMKFGPNSGEQTLDEETAVVDHASAGVSSLIAWASISTLLLALVAQRLLEPSGRQRNAALFFYTGAGLIFIFLFLRERAADHQAKIAIGVNFSVKVRLNSLLASFILGILTFLVFKGHQFNLLNMIVWVGSIATGVWAFWDPGSFSMDKFYSKIGAFFKKPEIRIKFSYWSVLLILSAVVVIFFRLYQLGQVPGEMFSDHAEKLLDVADVISGQHWVFFPRNTGREAIQMYLTAAIATWLGTGLSFISLKIGTALAGLLALPFIYLLGKEIGNKWVGLFAFIFAGIAYWPNVISRVGLRFPLYPLFVAPAMYFFIRGAKRSNRNDFILSGLFVGLGLHGYSSTRFLPFVLGAGLVIYLLHRVSRGKRMQATLSFAAMGFVAFLVFIPLFRYWVDNAEMFNYRALTRLGTIEQGYSAPVMVIFFKNLWRAVIMFFWDNGNIWVHSIPGRPALDVVSAALLFLGILLLILRYIRQRDWTDLFLLVSIPLLMMPSILSLAFPDENPSLNRTGGAIVPVFLIVAIALEYILSRIIKTMRGNSGKMVAGVIFLILTGWSINQNYDLVFNQYKQEFLAGAWNTSEIGQVIHDFADSIGTRDTAYVVPYPYWVDTRLVGINAGFPEKDYALWPEQFATTLTLQGPKLFILKPEDQESLELLEEDYPHGYASLHQSSLPGKDFVIFFVPVEAATLSSAPTGIP